MKKTDLLVRNMRREELDQVIDWAAEEGWNPGLNDANVFWACDPDGFIVAEYQGELLGGGSIVSYEGKFGFMGLFIVRPKFRGKGLGGQLWHKRLNRLKARLQPPAKIGMDGVFDMQAWYARGGFAFSARNLRFEGRAKASDQSTHTADLSAVPFSLLDRYDQAHFPAPRSRFLQHWINSPGSFGNAVMRQGAVAGYGLIRPCRTGYKFGPLFADDLSTANLIYRDLCSRIAGEPVFLDVPEANPAALSLAQAEGMTEVFGCARMYFGPQPELPIHEIFGITSFELG
jgi:GNAT superfamily N-acetyltransferase